MRHESHVGLVYTHTKRNRRHDNQTIFHQKLMLILLPQFIAHPGMIGQSPQAFLIQPFSGFFDFFTGQAIHNPGITRVFRANKIQQLLAGIIFLDNAITNIRTIETTDKHLSIFERQTLNDFLAGAFIGCSG